MWGGWGAENIFQHDIELILYDRYVEKISRPLFVRNIRLDLGLNIYIRLLSTD